MTQAPSQSESINELLTALSKAQSKIQCAIKNNKSSFFKDHSYADLNSVWEACRDQLTSNGLSVIQSTEGTRETLCLVTTLGHSSGQWIKSYLPLMLTKFDPQALGSAMTYAKRYALSAMVGVCADEDDDGERAMNRISEENVRKSYTPKQENVKKSNIPLPSPPPKVEDLPYLTDEEMEVYDKFIYLIPENDRENAKKYIDAVSKTKKMRVIDVVAYANKNMEKFKENLIKYKADEKEASLKKAV
jgi:hypothetical protein